MPQVNEIHWSTFFFVTFLAFISGATALNFLSVPNFKNYHIQILFPHFMLTI